MKQVWKEEDEDEKYPFAFLNSFIFRRSIKLTQDITIISIVNVNIKHDEVKVVVVISLINLFSLYFLLILANFKAKERVANNLKLLCNTI